MRRSASILGLIVFAAMALAPTASRAAESCRYDDIGKLRCTESGVTPGDSRSTTPRPRPRTGPQYIYTLTDPVIGDCHYWSNVPGGIDAWNALNDIEVIAAALLPACPVVPPVDVPATAWEIFRSWTLDPPVPALQPLDRGITGLGRSRTDDHTASAGPGRRREYPRPLPLPHRRGPQRASRPSGRGA